MKRLIRNRTALGLCCLLCCSTCLFALQAPDLRRQMTSAAQALTASLSEAQRASLLVPFNDASRYDWNYTPRKRRGLTLKEMTPAQRTRAMNLLRVVLSREGYLKAGQIILLENVLRVVENRPANDTYRDPENYAFLIFGTPGEAVWGWRMEGHHLSLHFSAVNDHIAFLPGFMGSNPGRVTADVPQKGMEILKAESGLALRLLHSLTPAQQQKAILSPKAPGDILTGNSRKISLENREGLPMSAMTPAQKNLFKALIGSYLERYHVTLRNQQWRRLEAQGLEKLVFAWMGTQAPGHTDNSDNGHYYRIQGPTLLIEYDNTQNNGNHVHSVVRDLENDFGEDLLGRHYAEDHKK